MEIRPINDEEVPAWRAALAQTFGMDQAVDPTGDERLRAICDLSRTFAAFDRGQIVGTTSGFDFSLTVPGGSVPMSGLTMVTVRPTHRRRGLLKAMIQAHLDAARAHGDPISGLWASESTIYGRFGYGVAAEGDVLTFNAAGAKVAEGEPLDEVEQVSDEVAAEHVPALYDRVMASRPGMFTRSAAWWKYRRFIDRADIRGGASPRRYTLVRRDDGTLSGYIAARQRLAWEKNQTVGGFEIDELIAVDARAEATLWAYASNIDLFPRVSHWNAPTDALLPWLANDRRRVIRRRIETLWLRPDDVPALIAARTFGADGALRFAVEGEGYELVVEGGVGRCVRSDEAPAIELGRSAFGSLYLGSFAPTLFARAGRIRGQAPALALADRMFASRVTPWIAEIF